MTTVDERVVAMKMDYAQFEKGTSATTKALELLKKALAFDKENKSLTDLQNTTKTFSLQGIADGVEGIMGKFSALSVMGITALATITQKAVDAGLQIAKSLTIDPIKAGFDEYELKMGSIQTILANTARYGTQLPEVTDNLEELNKYADKTIYNFGDMTKNIGLFTNAGIRIGDATSMIKGFSNEAAASGTSAQGAAGAAYQLSQALSAGTIRLMDWRSLQNVGMGNKNMQNGLIEIADAMGTLTANSIDAATVQADFNGSLEKNWLSADVMSTYLKIMAGDYDAASMAALGLSEEQIKAFQAQAKMGEDAATKVRTWTQLIGTLQESVGSGWSETFDLLIGDFDTATELWTGVNNKLGPIVDAMSDARNNLIEAFVNAGGRDAVIGTLSSAFNTLMDIIRVVKRAFTDIFPPVTGEQLAALAKTVQEFVEGLRPTPKVFREIQSVAKGFFAALDIGRMIFVEIAKVVGTLLSALFGLGGGVLEVGANFGDSIVQFRDWLKEGTVIENVFGRISKALQTVIGWIAELGKWTSDTLGAISFQKVWEGIATAIASVGKALGTAWEWIKEVFGNIKDAVKAFFETMDFNVLIGMLNLGALGGIAFILKKAFDGIKKIMEGGIMGLFKGAGGEGGGIIDSIKGIFGTLTDTMENMQATLKSAQLVAIAAAIGILAGAVLILSTIDTAQLYISLGAMGLMFAQLSGAMIVLDKFTSSGGAVKMGAIGVSMVLMASAMVILAAAVKIFATMDWEELARGFSALAVGMGIMVGAMTLVHSKVFAAASMLIMATAITILAGALKIMATMTWDDILRGMTVLASSVAILVGAMTLMHSKVFAAASMLVIAVAMTVLAGAMKIFGTMSWDEIGRSMVLLGGSLAILAVALELIHSKVFAAASLLIISAAMTVLAGALKVMGSMSWDEIGRGLTVLAGSLAILAGAMALMGIPLVLLGAVGIVAAAGALMMLAPAMKLLGTMSWDAIGRGLTVLAGALGILAIGGVLLLPAIPAFMGLGVAIALIGAGVFLAGVGLAGMAAGITALAAAGTVGAEAIKMALLTLIDLIPLAMAKLAEGIIQFALVIAGGATEFTAAMTTLLMSLITAIQTLAPEIINTLVMLVMMMFDTLVENVPKLVDGGLRLLTGILDGIANNIGKIIDSATNIIVNLLDGIGRNIPKIVQAGADLVLDFINGIAKGIRDNTQAFIRAGNNLFKAIVDGVAQAIENGGNLLAWAGKRIGNAIIEGAKNALGINSPSKVFRDYIMGSVFEGLDDGTEGGLKSAARAGSTIGDNVINGAKQAISAAGDLMRGLNINTNPVIKPVVDLSEAQKSTAQLAGMFGTQQLDLAATYASAEGAADAVDEAGVLVGAGASVREGDTYIYNQTNNSPKALSESTIYRQTKNQLSNVKTKRKED